jgi:hypothetical protein
MSAQNLGRVGTPIPQENLGCFFIRKSLKDLCVHRSLKEERLEGMVGSVLVSSVFHTIENRYKPPSAQRIMNGEGCISIN